MQCVADVHLVGCFAQQRHPVRFAVITAHQKDRRREAKETLHVVTLHNDPILRVRPPIDSFPGQLREGMVVAIAAELMLFDTKGNVTPGAQCW